MVEGYDMKTIIAGSRDIKNYALVMQAIKNSAFDITEVVCGGAQGVDLFGERYALENRIPVQYFEIEKNDWAKYGRGAGPLRNEKMAKYADALIAVWNGHSNGTRNMITLAKKYNLKIYIQERKFL